MSWFRLLVLGGLAGVGLTTCTRAQSCPEPTPPPIELINFSPVCREDPDYPGCGSRVRCEDEEPDCGPEPVWDSQSCYQPSAPRIPHPLPFCMASEGYRPSLCDQGAGKGLASEDSELNLWCGCVEGECRMFTQ